MQTKACTKKANSLASEPIKCGNCSIKKLCLPVMLAEAEIDHLETIVQQGNTLHKNTPLFHAGQKFEQVYAIRSGSFVSTSNTENGDEQITGFFLPGEIIGLDAISSGTHKTSARALETSSVCAIPFDRLQEIALVIPTLQNQMFKIMSQEISEEHELMMLLGKKSAEERLAAFLINLSQRFKRRGLSSFQFRLSMTRSQIGNHLGLAVETVSRLITRFCASGLIQAEDREIKILNMVALSTMAGVSCHT